MKAPRQKSTADVLVELAPLLPLLIEVERRIYAAVAMHGILCSLPKNAEYDALMTAELAIDHADALQKRLNRSMPRPKD